MRGGAAMNKNYEPDCAHLRWMVVNNKRKRTWICQDCGTEQHRPFDDTQTPNPYCEGCGALFDCKCVRDERGIFRRDADMAHRLTGGTMSDCAVCGHARHAHRTAAKWRDDPYDTGCVFGYEGRKSDTRCTCPEYVASEPPTDSPGPDE